GHEHRRYGDSCRRAGPSDRPRQPAISHPQQPQGKGTLIMTGKRIYLTPTPVRIWHWLNAFGIVTLCLTGLQLRFPEYVDLFGSYKGAVRLHNTAGIVVSVSFLLWLGYYLLVTGTLARLYLPNRLDLQYGLLRQAKYYFLTFFLGHSSP